MGLSIPVLLVAAFIVGVWAALRRRSARTRQAVSGVTLKTSMKSPYLKVTMDSLFGEAQGAKGPQVPPEPEELPPPSLFGLGIFDEPMVGSDDEELPESVVGVDSDGGGAGAGFTALFSCDDVPAHGEVLRLSRFTEQLSAAQQSDTAPRFHPARGARASLDLPEDQSRDRGSRAGTGRLLSNRS